MGGLKCGEVSTAGIQAKSLHEWPMALQDTIVVKVVKLYHVTFILSYDNYC